MSPAQARAKVCKDGVTRSHPANLRPTGGAAETSALDRWQRLTRTNRVENSPILPNGSRLSCARTTDGGMWRCHVVGFDCKAS